MGTWLLVLSLLNFLSSTGAWSLQQKFLFLFSSKLNICKCYNLADFCGLIQKQMLKLEIEDRDLIKLIKLI